VVDALQIYQLAAKPDAARARTMHAGEHLDQGGFAGAIFAEQHVRFPGSQLEIHSIERQNARKLLGYALSL